MSRRTFLKRAGLVGAGVSAAVVAGCDNKAEEKVASPTCADLEEIKGPAQRAELLKKCPRLGSGFKPSDTREW